jgi:TP901 family phage tail tape measure protein
MATSTALNILVTAQTELAQAKLRAVDAQLKKTAATATGTTGAMGGLSKGTVGAVAGFAAVGAAAVIAGKQLYNLGQEFDDAYDTIRVGTGATGKELEKLKGNFKNVAKTVPNDFKQVGEAVADLNTRMGLTGDSLEAMSAQIRHLSNITDTDLRSNIKSVARAFVDWEVPVKRQTAALDGLFRLSQVSGASVSEIADNIQKFGSPLRTLGLDIDYAAAMFANFERAGVNMQTMVPGLKLAIGNMTDPTAELGAKFEELGVSANDLPGGLKLIFDALSKRSGTRKQRTT